MTERVAIMMTKTELTAIDDWMFANRIRSRGEAIRRLCGESLAKSDDQASASGRIHDFRKQGAAS